jgi:hypothetical protein
MVKYNHSTYCSKNAALVDVDGNLILDDEGNSVNLWRGLKKVKESGKIKVAKDLSSKAGQGFVYLYSNDTQKKTFDDFRQSKEKDWKGRQMFHVYLEPLANGDIIKTKSKKIVENVDEDSFNYYGKGR